MTLEVLQSFVTTEMQRPLVKKAVEAQSKHLLTSVVILGLTTALVERDDFSSGTSSRSTKLIHGGVRYLQKAIMQLDREQVRSLFVWISLWR